VLYNLAKRGIEADLLPWSRARGIPIMAYSPIDQGCILRNRALAAAAARHRATPAQISLSWVLRHQDMRVIPKSTNETHIRENREALDLALSTPPTRRVGQGLSPSHRRGLPRNVVNAVIRASCNSADE
jgi:diketogulonate reductase-like aldo/keto reductase